MGPEFSKTLFKIDNSRVIIEKFLPGLKCSQIAKLCINSGSHGTITQALYFGKPSICILHNVDQATFAKRIVEIGCGVDLVDYKSSSRDFGIWKKKAQHIDETQIINSVNFLLQNLSTYVRSCQKVCKEIRTYNEPTVKALDLIEHFVKNF